MILCAGVTGFQPAPSIEVKAFKAICYASFAPHRVEFVENDGLANNFYECIIQLDNRKVHVLLNRQYPFIAFSSTRSVDEETFPFIDDMKLRNCFSPYYRVLTVEQLNEPIIKRQRGKNMVLDNEHNLHDAELKELAFWKPKTVGEVVFNNWD